jgi:molybdopterin-guanine dinucleotide biosynthesis protein A
MRVAAILAGGASRRMGGQDKALLDVRGARLVDHVIARLAPQVDLVCLVAPTDYETGLPAVADDPGFEGPLAGVFGMQTWMQDTHPDVESFLTAPVDAPLCPLDLAERLETFDGSAIAADPQRVHPTFACWHVAELARAREAVGSSGSLHSLAEEVGAWPARWESAAPFLNLNMPEDVLDFMAREKANDR